MRFPYTWWVQLSASVKRTPSNALDRILSESVERAIRRFTSLYGKKEVLDFPGMQQRWMKTYWQLLQRINERKLRWNKDTSVSWKRTTLQHNPVVENAAFSDVVDCYNGKAAGYFFSSYRTPLISGLLRMTHVMTITLSHTRHSITSGENPLQRPTCFPFGYLLSASCFVLSISLLSLITIQISQCDWWEPFLWVAVGLRFYQASLVRSPQL